MKATFLVLGDWGWDQSNEGHLWHHDDLQKNIANEMKRAMEEYQPKFVINVGDSFYPNGIASRTDAKWQNTWSNIYGPDLTNLPWFSVYGNHDYEGKDGCARASSKTDTSQCAQVLADQANWIMPKLWYSSEDLLQPGTGDESGIPVSDSLKQRYSNAYDMLKSIGVEIIALDFNSKTDGGPNNICKYGDPGDKGGCMQRLYDRYGMSRDLLQAKYEAAASAGKPVIVFSHYPSNYIAGDSLIMNILKSSRVPLAYFGGHTHKVGQVQSPNLGANQKNNWIVGGGGGWACESSGNQGFVLGTIYSDGTISTEMKSVGRSGCNHGAMWAQNATSSKDAAQAAIVV